MAIFCSFFFAFERGSKVSKRAPFCLYATCVVCGRVLDFQRIRQLQNIFTDLSLIGQPSSLGSDTMVKKQKVRWLLSYSQSPENTLSTGEAGELFTWGLPLCLKVTLEEILRLWKSTYCQWVDHGLKDCRVCSVWSLIVTFSGGGLSTLHSSTF